MARSHSIVRDRGSSITPPRPSPRCSHHVRMRRANCGSGGEDTKRRCLSSAQPPCEPALPMRCSPHGGTPIRGALAAVARRARHRALADMRRSAPRIRTRALPAMPARLPTGVFVQSEVFLSQLPPEARARLRRLGGTKRARASAAPAVRVYRTANCETLKSPPELRGEGRGVAIFAPPG